MCNVPIHHSRLRYKHEIRENRILCNELVESKPINAISNEHARKKIEELYKRGYYFLLYSYKFGNIPIGTNTKYIQVHTSIYKSLFVQTLENTENEKN